MFVANVRERVGSGREEVWFSMGGWRRGCVWYTGEVSDKPASDKG